MLKLPFYGYMVAKGFGSVREERDSGWNKKNSKSITDLIAALSRAEMQTFAGEYFVAEEGTPDSRTWLVDTILETDTVNRVGLENLLARLKGHGTILIPKKSHIFENNLVLLKILKLVNRQNIAIVSVSGNKSPENRHEIYSLLDFEGSDLIDRTIRNAVDNAIAVRDWVGGMSNAVHSKKGI